MAFAVACAHCPDTPPPEDVAELALTGAAEAFTAWIDVETDRAKLLPEPGRGERLGELVEANRLWNEIEDGFDAAQDAYRTAKAASAVTLPDAERRARAAYDRALAFLEQLGVKVP